MEFPLTRKPFTAWQRLTTNAHEVESGDDVIRAEDTCVWQHRQLDDERYVLFVPGDISTAVVIFTREPSARQVARVQDIHRDFERANRHALQSGDYEVERLVFPHRALFEERP